MLVKLTNKQNTYKWSTEAIRISIEQTAKVLIGEGDYTIRTRFAGTVGPYQVAMPKKVAAALIEDGETDIFEIDATANQDAVTFQVVELDEHGREMSDEVKAKVMQRRQERRAEKDAEERSRTLRFFFEGTVGVHH